MALYSVANRTTNVTIANATIEMIAGSANAPRFLEIGIMLNAATQSVIGLGTPAATGITPTSPVTVLPEATENTSAGQTTTALAWGTGPTVPANFFRRVNIPAAIGAGVVLTFPRGISVLKTKSLVLWNITAISVLDTWCVVDE